MFLMTMGPRFVVGLDDSTHPTLSLTRGIGQSFAGVIQPNAAFRRQQVDVMLQRIRLQ